MTIASGIDKAALYFDFPAGGEMMQLNPILPAVLIRAAACVFALDRLP